MKTLKSTKPLPDLAEKVRLARLRLAKAEHQLATAKAQSQLARQRRKEAKQAARAAKKVARLAKDRVERAETALARLEARMAQAPRAPVKGPPRKSQVKTPAKKAAAKPRRKRPLDVIVLRSQMISKSKKPAARRIKAKPAVTPIMASEKASSPVLSELETPVEVLPILEHKPTPEIVKGVEEIFTDETGTPEIPAPATETSTLTETPATSSTLNA